MNKGLSGTFHGVHNFRKLGKLPIYRSAAWDFVNNDEKRSIIRELGITDRIDLRSDLELENSKDAGVHTDITGTITNHLKHCDVECLKAFSYIDNVTKYQINFITNSFKYNSVWRRLTWSQTATLGYYILTNQREEMKKYVNEHILSPNGILGMYMDFIDYSRDSIITAVRLVEFLLKHNRTIHISCMKGCDRTGIVCAFVRHIHGDSLDEIVNDYTLSEDGINRLPFEERQKYLVEGLCDDFNHTRKETILGLWEYVIDNYGSIDKYLLAF